MQSFPFSSRPWVAPLVTFAAATCIKILFIPAYRSTDFEVHRNWLAVTHSSPISRWYVEETSEWTLDYPPLFAWFEWLWSWPAAAIDPEIVKVENLNYSSTSCVLFQRLSVIFSDFVLLYAIVQHCKLKMSQAMSDDEAKMKTWIISLLILLNSGLFIVDHIHFQYNGFLYGILLLSIIKIFQGRHFQAAGLFAVLLNFKHIFLYIAPAYFIYLLKHQCFKVRPSNQSGNRVAMHRSFSFMDFIKLGAVVIGVTVVSFAPFIYFGQVQQVFSRLFPFKRGLCHAYWAPNVWVLYNIADQAIAILGSKLGILSTSSGSMTSGIVGGMKHQVLPSIPPWITLLLTVAAMLPALFRLWIKPSSSIEFLKCLILCGYGSFLFGWHVHEKAIMMITIPLCLLIIEDGRYRVFILLSSVAHISLFPLLFNAAEMIIKICLFFLYLVIVLASSQLTRPSSMLVSGILQQTGMTKGEIGYLIFCIVIQFYCLFIHSNIAFLNHLEFLPLLLTSFACSLGVLWTWYLTYIS